MLTEIKNKTKEIVEIVARENFNGRIGLLSGSAGSLFLLCYYSEYADEPIYLDMAEQRILDAFDIINDTQFSDLTFSNGLTGFLWTLKNLNKHQYIDIDLTEVTDSAESLLGDFMMAKLEEGNYDFLHGALGIANYFIDSEDPKTLKLMKDFNEKFFNSAIKNDDKELLSFLSTVIIDDAVVPVTNMSLSHGMASIIYYLQRCLKNKNIASAEIENALKKIIAYYRKNQNDITTHTAYFPSWIRNDIPNKNSRLAWCYGDLGIGHAFSMAADTLNDPGLKAYGTEILKKTVTRLDPTTEAIREGGLCHGASGLVKMYRTIYRNTGIKDFNITADHWLKVTLEQATHSDGYAGYKTYSAAKGYENDCGLLEGVGGIGIVFLEELMRKQLAWDGALLLS